MTDKEILNELKLRQNKLKRRDLIQKILCFFGFHTPYYKYGPYRSITYNTNPPSASNGPEHLGYHCRQCDLNLGRFRGSRYWFQIEIPRK